MFRDSIFLILKSKKSVKPMLAQALKSRGDKRVCRVSLSTNQNEAGSEAC